MEPTVVVVGLDLSEGSISSLKFALELTRGTEVSFHVVHCIEEKDANDAVQDPRNLQRVNAAHDHVVQIVEGVCPSSTTHSTHVLFSVSPSEEICHLAEKFKADLIVVGAGANCSFALGSCAEGVLRGANRPVMVARTPRTATNA